MQARASEEVEYLFLPSKRKRASAQARAREAKQHLPLRSEQARERDKKNTTERRGEGGGVAEKAGSSVSSSLRLGRGRKKNVDDACSLSFSFPLQLSLSFSVSLSHHQTHRERCARPRSCPCRRRTGGRRPCRAPVGFGSFGSFEFFFAERSSSAVARSKFSPFPLSLKGVPARSFSFLYFERIQTRRKKLLNQTYA